MFEDIHINIADETIQGDSTNDDSPPTSSQPCAMTRSQVRSHDSSHPDETSTPDVIVYEQYYERTCSCDEDHDNVVNSSVFSTL